MSDSYSLPTGKSDIDRLTILNSFYNCSSYNLLKKAEINPWATGIEFGCGQGQICQFIASEIVPNGKIHAVDISAEQIEIARERTRQFNNIEFLVSDVLDLPIENETIDFIYFRFFLLHVNDPEKILIKCKELLKPGGKLICELTDVSSIRYLPEKKGFSQWVNYWYKLGEYLEASYTIYQQAYPLLKKFGFKIESLNLYQPISESQEAKLCHILGFESLYEQYLKYGGASDRDLEKLRAIHAECLSDRNTIVELYRNYQFICQK
jgi:ubiquinone/menaquinone biosynthesis C-methylase UbiE